MLVDLLYRYSQRPNGKSTCLIKALEHAYSHSLSRENGGRRGAPDFVQQDIIIITDGLVARFLNWLFLAFQTCCLRVAKQIIHVAPVSAGFVFSCMNRFVKIVYLSSNDTLVYKQADTSTSWSSRKFDYSRPIFVSDSAVLMGT